MTDKLKILAVDDEEINLLLLEELLCRDYDFIPLTSGQECLDYPLKSCKKKKSICFAAIY